jgi:TPR repeat protein
MSTDQGNTLAQLNYGYLLSRGEGSAMNKSLSALRFRLSADQGNVSAQLMYGDLLSRVDRIAMNKCVTAQDFKSPTDQNDKLIQRNINRTGF